MQRFYQVLILCLFVPATVPAQETVWKPPESGMAVLFSLNGLSALGADDFGSTDFSDTSIVGGVGLKFLLSPELALRANLGFGNTGITEKAGTTELKFNGTYFWLMPGIQYNLVRVERLNGYIGGQILFASASFTIEGATSKSEGSETHFGAGAFLGFEWFAFDGISLSAEYALMFRTLSGTRTSDGESSDLPSSTKITLKSNNSAHLILSFYL